MTSIVSGAARSVYRLAYEISPIFLTGGIAALIPGGILPIIALTESESASIDLLNGSFSLGDLSDYFAHWEPVPGSTLVANQIGQYPFANQTVAANAIIQQPLNISMLVKCPVKGTGGYAARLATMTTLKLALDKHHQNGGLYTVVTPSWIYTNCIMTGMTDVTQGGTHQTQIMWRLDFQQPLVTQSNAIQVANAMIQKITNGLAL